jgi:hypothetical protein
MGLLFSDLKYFNVLFNSLVFFNYYSRVPQSDEIIGHWLPTTQEQPRYLQMDLESPVLVNDVMPFHSRLDFWTTLLGSYSGVSVKEEL